jgi:glycerate 2-kinase
MTVVPESLMTASMRSAAWGNAAALVMAAALEAVDPGVAVREHLHREKNQLLLSGKTYDLSAYRRIVLIGAGKAGVPMAQASAELLGDYLEGGLVIVKEGYLGDPIDPDIEIIEAGHPIPDRRGQEATLRMLDMLDGLGQNDLVLFLISGGGSALMHVPVEGVSLEDLQQLTSTLLAVGANITEINSLRKHLDRVKGGGLARAAAPAEMVTLVLSDVIGDPLDVIASGPTVPDSSTFQDAWKVLERYAILDQIPVSVREHLSRGVRGEIPDTPKRDDPIFERGAHIILGNNRRAAEAAARTARSSGFRSLLLTSRLQGEARRAGKILGALARQVRMAGGSDPFCLIAGGETTVTVSGDGHGGRNQELALGAVEELAGLDGVGLLALATDGGDGPTDAAGAVVTGESLERAMLLGLDPRAYLARNDAYHFFEPLGDLLKPGPTQTNVNDLTFLFVT